MPDYTNIEDVAMRHAGRIGAPGFIATPGGRTYNIFPEGSRGPVYEYYPTSTGGRPDLRSISVAGGEVGAELDLFDMPEQDYEMGRIVIKRQFLEDMKNADGFKSVSPETYVALAEEARMTMQSRLLRLEQNKSRAEMHFKQIAQNPNLNKSERYEAMSKYYNSNPVFEPAKVRAAGSLTMREQILGEIMAGMKETPESLTPETETGQPEIRPVITAEGEEVKPPSVLPTAEQIAEYKRLGGSKTTEGRAYAREFIESAEKKPAVQPISATTPPKPIGYPDAVWDSQRQAWTIIRKGKLKVWRP